MSKAVKTAFIANFCIFVVKTIAAVMTRSAGMTAEAVHSLADCGNQLLLMLGMKRSRKEATANHPFGHGKEEYFWSFIVAMLLFVLGGVYSLYEGVHKLMHPEPIRWAYVNLVILAGSFFPEGWSWLVAKKELDCTVSEMFEEAADSKDASTVVTLTEDTSALLGLGFAFIGTVASMITGNPIYDAISSVIIGVLLFVTAFFLANEMRKLVIGEAIDPVEVRYIRMVLNHHPDVLKVGTIKTMQMGNESCIVAANVDFRHELHDEELEKVIDELKDRIRVHVPDAGNNIFLQPQRLTE